MRMLLLIPWEKFLDCLYLLLQLRLLHRRSWHTSRWCRIFLVKFYFTLEFFTFMQPPFLLSGQPGSLLTRMLLWPCKNWHVCESGTKPSKCRIIFDDEDQGKNYNFQESRLNENTSTM
jgi:hypothetical protein